MSVNKVILLGFLGSDPEIGLTKFQKPLCTLRLAIERLTQSGKVTDWHTVVTFDELAAHCSKCAVRGRQILVEGKLTSWSRTDVVSGERRRLTAIVASSVAFLGNEDLSEVQLTQLEADCLSADANCTIEELSPSN